jgi:ubiquinone/menaquinone biosynthesis C-methylase UbiE
LDWLLRARHGGDAAYAAALQPMLDAIRTGLLDHAGLRPHQSIADIGCGTGFAGFGALDREPTSRLTFVDIEPALLEHVRGEAQLRGVADACRFVVAPAGALDALASASLDVVLVRAVLAYAADKPAAIAEFRRILRPGGRISIVDPIFHDRAVAIAGMAHYVQSAAAGEVGRRVELLHRLSAAQFPDSLEAIQADPLTNYTERDLLHWLVAAGFVNVHLRLHIDAVPALPMPWSAFLRSSPHAGVPAVGDILQARLRPDERVEFERFFRSGIESGTAVERNVNAYLYADVP